MVAVSRAYGIRRTVRIRLIRSADSEGMEIVNKPDFIGQIRPATQRNCM
jgi:hypothetical protein